MAQASAMFSAAFRPHTHALIVMEINIAVVAEYAFVDQQGRLGIIGVFDVLGAPGFPVLHPQMFLALRIECRPIEVGTRHRLTVALQDQDGERSIPDMNADVQISKPPYPGAPRSYLQTVLQFQGLLFNKPGTYSFEIAIDGQHKTSVPLYVMQAQPPKPK